MVGGLDSLDFRPFGNCHKDFVMPAPFTQRSGTACQDVVQGAWGCTAPLAGRALFFAPGLEVAWAWQEVSHCAEKEDKPALISELTEFLPGQRAVECLVPLHPLPLGGKPNCLHSAVLFSCLLDPLTFSSFDRSSVVTALALVALNFSTTDETGKRSLEVLLYKLTELKAGGTPSNLWRNLLHCLSIASTWVVERL